MNRFGRDLAGTVHVIQVMFVGLLLSGAVVFVATMNNPVTDPAFESKPISDEDVEDVLNLRRALPAQSPTVHYTHRLEELIIENMMDPDRYQQYTGTERGPMSPFEEYLQRAGNHEAYRAHLSTEGRQLLVTGPVDPDFDIPATGTSFWGAETGTTLVKPTMSVHDPGLLVQAQLVPLWINRLHQPAGVPMIVELELKKTGGDAVFTRSTEHGVQLPHDHLTQSLRLVPRDPASLDPLWFLDESDLDIEDSIRTWPVHVQIEPFDENGRWLREGAVLEIERPPGWGAPDVDSLHWQRQNPHAEAVWRMEYVGPSKQLDDEAWLNFTMERPEDLGVDNHQHVTVRFLEPVQTHASVVLNPGELAQNLPFVVHASHPDPLPWNDDAEVVLRVVNPLDEEVELEALRVVFPENGERFSLTTSQNWTQDLDTDAFSVTYLSGQSQQTLGAGDTGTYSLRIEMLEGKRGGLGNGGAPLLEYLGDGIQVPLDDADRVYHDALDAMRGVPVGPAGHYMAWVDPEPLGDGTHTLRVPYEETAGVPPGVGQFEVQTGSLSLLKELQEARHEARMILDPGVHAPGEDLHVRMELGEMLPLLRQVHDVGDLSSNQISLNVTWASMLDHLWGGQDGGFNASLDLEWGSGVVGLDWVGDSGDLVVGYEDGHVVRLDGGSLPGTALWRDRVAGSLTAGPLFLGGDGEDVEDRLVVFGEEELLVLDSGSGEVLESHAVPGVVEELAFTTCVGDHEGVGFLAGAGLVGAANARDLLGVKRGGDALWARSYYFDVESGLMAGERFAGSLPVGVDAGVFGLYGECSLVAGVSEPAGEGKVVRYAVPEMGLAWEQEVPAGVGGVFAARVSQLPYEEHAGVDLDQVVVVRGDGGYEVHGGVVPRGDPTSMVLEGFQGGDVLLGLSWVDHAVGYVASERGHVWRSVDGGASWRMLEDSPITRQGGLLVDFAFGGNGNGLFVQDDDLVSYFDGENFGGWISVDGGEILGLGETGTEPGVILRLTRDEATEFRLWDPVDEGATGDLVLSLDCLCTEAIGHENALLGWIENEVRARLPGLDEDWTAARTGLAYSLGPSGHLLEFRQEEVQEDEGEDEGERGLPLPGSGDEDEGVGEPGLLVFDIRSNELVAHLELDPDVLDDLKIGLSSARSMHRAGLTHSGGLLTVGSDGFPQRISSDLPDVVGVSGGPGPSFFVLDDRVAPMTQPEHHLLQIKTSQGITSGELTLSFEGDGENAEGIEWRLLAQNLTTEWTGLEASLVADDLTDGFIELKRPMGSFQALGDPALEIVNGSTSEMWAGSRDPTCSGCLVPVADSRSLVSGGGFWLDPDGLAPRDHSADLVGGHGFADRGDAGVFLAGGILGEEWSHEVRAGLPWRGLGLDEHLGPAVYHNVRDPGGDDLLLVEQGVVGPVEADLDPLTVDLRSAQKGLSLVNPESGSACDFSRTDAYAMDAYEALATDSGGVVVGSNLGALSQWGPDCYGDWSADPLQAGSVFQLTIPTDERALPGSVVVEANIVLETQELGEVSLDFIAQSFRAKNGVPMTIVFFDAHLQYWLRPMYEWS